MRYDILDTRDLVSERDYLIEQRDAGNDWDDDQAERLADIEQLFEDVRGYADDPEHGVQLIADGYFTEYAQELADDLGLIPRDYSWPTSCIDWEQAARELQMDYTAVEFDGGTWWIR
jgi:hypothetical protein